MTAETLLIRQLRKSDLGAFRRVFDQYAPLVYQFAFSLLKTPEKAQEAVCEVFSGLWRKRESLGDSLSLGGYLFSLSYKALVVAFQDMNGPYRLQKLLYDLTTQSSTATEERLLYRELELLYQQAVAQLPAHRREIYRLNYQEGLSPEQIAQRLDQSVSSVEEELFCTFESLETFFHQQTY